MRHSPFALYPRTALFTALYDCRRAQADRAAAARGDPARARRGAPRPTALLVGHGARQPLGSGVTYGTAPARDGHEIPLRIYRPRDLRDTETDVPVVVFLHGGGLVQGNVVMYDPLCMHVAEQVRAVVVSVDYRLAPEHRAPTAAHDAVDATTLGGRPRRGAAGRHQPARGLSATAPGATSPRSWPSELRDRGDTRCATRPCSTRRPT